jgi:hypothetical protein
LEGENKFFFSQFITMRVREPFSSSLFSLRSAAHARIAFLGCVEFPMENDDFMSFVAKTNAAAKISLHSSRYGEEKVEFLENDRFSDFQAT